MDEPMDSSVESTTGDAGERGVLSSSSDVLSSTGDPAMRSSRSQSEPIVTSSGNIETDLDCQSGISQQDPEVAKPRFSPLLRPGSMVMMTLTEKDYEGYYWPELKTAIDQLLNMKPGAYIPISYEQMYSCVYKCVCKQFSERLYGDLLSHLTEHMATLNSRIHSSDSEAVQFIETFSFLMHQYIQALTGIVPIFNYLNRFYVENKLKTDLNEELRKLFRLKVVDVHIQALLQRLEQVSHIPFAISPPTMASIIKNLYALNQDYSRLCPGLFSRFLPGILPPSEADQLAVYAAEARSLAQQTQSLQDFSHDRSRKRVYEDDISVN